MLRYRSSACSQRPSCEAKLRAASPGAADGPSQELREAQLASLKRAAEGEDTLNPKP